MGKTQAMQLTEILKPGAVRSLGQVTSKKRLFQELADLAHAEYGLTATEVLDALQERESLGPTGVGQGVALPHARLHGLDRVVGLFVRLDRPLDFDAVDRQPVDLGRHRGVVVAVAAGEHHDGVLRRREHGRSDGVANARPEHRGCTPNRHP